MQELGELNTALQIEPCEQLGGREGSSCCGSNPQRRSWAREINQVCIGNHGYVIQNGGLLEFPAPSHSQRDAISSLRCALSFIRQCERIKHRRQYSCA